MTVWIYRTPVKGNPSRRLGVFLSFTAGLWIYSAKRTKVPKSAIIPLSEVATATVGPSTQDIPQDTPQVTPQRLESKVGGTNRILLCAA